MPPSPQQLSLDIVALGLDDPEGGVPDALEISLLDANRQSLVPTFAGHATSYFNANPAVAVGSGLNEDMPVSLAPGVTFDGTTVTLDISGLAAGTQATLYVDLVGNPPGSSSVASIDNVRVTPERVYTHTFTAVPLAGPFVSTAGIVYADVDGDGHGDIVAADGGADKLLVYNGNGGGQYQRSELDLAGFGSGPLAVDAAPLTAGDAIADVAVTLLDAAFGASATWCKRWSRPRCVPHRAPPARHGFLLSMPTGRVCFVTAQTAVCWAICRCLAMATRATWPPTPRGKHCGCWAGTGRCTYWTRPATECWARGKPPV